MEKRSLIKLGKYAFYINLVMYSALCISSFLASGWHLFCLTLVICLRWYQTDELVEHYNLNLIDSNEVNRRQGRINDLQHEYTNELKSLIDEQVKINMELIKALGEVENRTTKLEKLVADGAR